MSNRPSFIGGVGGKVEDDIEYSEDRQEQSVEGTGDQTNDLALPAKAATIQEQEDEEEQPKPKPKKKFSRKKSKQAKKQEEEVAPPPMMMVTKQQEVTETDSGEFDVGDSDEGGIEVAATGSK